MKVISRKEFLAHYRDHILAGDVYINPTDTIYGLGCDATNADAVARVRTAKARETKPFSIIAPSKQWILEHCNVSRKDLKELPGPYTLIVQLKHKVLAPNVNPNGDTVGVRIPDHWFAKVAAKLKRPLVTTSANVSGRPFMTSVKDLDPSVAKHVAFCIDEGPKNGKPSTVIDLTQNRKRLR